MPSTHFSLHYHLVFSTKDREPMIARGWRERLHAFLGGAVRTMGGVAEAVGGTVDHVHLLVSLRATHCPADVVMEIKRSSSKWVHEVLRRASFSWQEGYGAFTVSPSKVAEVKKYTAHQEEHHRKKTFQQEYVEFLQRSCVEYDERYLW